LRSSADAATFASVTTCFGRLLALSALLAVTPGQDDPAALAARAQQLAQQGKLAELAPTHR